MSLLDSPLPDEAHEALRLAFLQAIADLKSTSVTVSDLRLALVSLNRVASGLARDRDRLTARLVALETVDPPSGLKEDQWQTTSPTPTSPS